MRMSPPPLIERNVANVPPSLGAMLKLLGKYPLFESNVVEPGEEESGRPELLHSMAVYWLQLLHGMAV